MNIVFRTDASRDIGTGHAMRCLTLADAMRQHDIQSIFLMRYVTDNIKDFILSKGYALCLLPQRTQADNVSNDDIYAKWLGTTIEQDAIDSCEALSKMDNIKGVILDHYGLDAEWELKIRNTVKFICVIDDLANRYHDADVLIDTNYYENYQGRYKNLVKENCDLYLGPKYALLRDEFSNHRKNLSKPFSSSRSLLITLGGVDQNNVTLNCLLALDYIDRFDDVNVVVGAANPHLDELSKFCKKKQYHLHIQCDYMGRLMHEADLAIGAGGVTTWERMCVGLPCLTLCIAENQKQMLYDAHQAGFLYAPNLDVNNPLAIANALQFLKNKLEFSENLAHVGRTLVDGNGSNRLAKMLAEKVLKNG